MDKATDNKKNIQQSSADASDKKWLERKDKSRIRSEALRKIIQYFKGK